MARNNSPDDYSTFGARWSGIGHEGVTIFDVSEDSGVGGKPTTIEVIVTGQADYAGLGLQRGTWAPVPANGFLRVGQSDVRTLRVRASSPGATIDVRVTPVAWS